MKREELIEILSKDGTLSEIEQFVAAKEITDEEKERIFDVLRAESKEDIEAKMKLVMADVEARPTYDSKFKQWQDWRKYRNHLVDETRTILLEKNACKSRVDEIIDMGESLREQYGEKIKDIWMSDITEEYQKNIDLYAVKTAQHSALALMHAEAKSEMQQQLSLEWAKRTQPIRDGLKQTWEKMLEITSHNKNVREAIKEVSKGIRSLSDNRTLDKVKKDVEIIKADVKALNEKKKAIADKEKELIAKANQVSMKQFKKDGHLFNLRAWGQGQPNPQYEQIKDITRAKEVLEQAEHMSRREQKSIHNINKDIENIKRSAQELEVEVNNKTQDVHNVFNHIEIEKLELVASIAEKFERGDFGAHTQAIDKKVKQYMEDYDGWSKEKASFEKDLKDALEGYEETFLERN